MAFVNGFTPAAYSIDGARHPGELFRIAEYAATNGTEGVMSPGDLKVKQLDGGAGTDILVDPGAALVLNRAANARNQTYAVNGRLQSRLPITSNAGKPVRQDLVVVRIDDPQYGFVLPNGADPLTYQYVRPFVIENVPSGTTTVAELNRADLPACLALARLDIPAGAVNISDAYIKPLRELAQPHSWSRQYGGSIDGLYTYAAGTKEAGDPFNMAPISNIRPTVAVPKWATHVDVVARLDGARVLDEFNNGALLVKLGSLYGPHINYDAPNQVGNDQNIMSFAASNIGAAVPLAMRGTNQQVNLRARFDIGRVRVDTWATLTYAISFYELTA